jgi:MtN3 and saliva related transmembrane protein
LTKWKAHLLNTSDKLNTSGPRNLGAVMDFTTLIGLGAAFCTTASYYPQLKKCWQTGSAGDLSLKMFLTLAAGVALWVVYGFLKSDLVIITANAVSLALLLGILSFKLRGRRPAA